MAVTVTKIAEPDKGRFGYSHPGDRTEKHGSGPVLREIFEVTVDADADASAVLNHTLGVIPAKVDVEHLNSAAAGLTAATNQAWFVASKTEAAVTLTKSGVGVGSGAGLGGAPSIRVVVSR